MFCKVKQFSPICCMEWAGNISSIDRSTCVYACKVCYSHPMTPMPLISESPTFNPFRNDLSLPLRIYVFIYPTVNGWAWYLPSCLLLIPLIFSFSRPYCLISCIVYLADTFTRSCVHCISPCEHILGTERVLFPLGLTDDIIQIRILYGLMLPPATRRHALHTYQ